MAGARLPLRAAGYCVDLGGGRGLRIGKGQRAPVPSGVFLGAGMMLCLGLLDQGSGGGGVGGSTHGLGGIGGVAAVGKVRNLAASKDLISS